MLNGSLSVWVVLFAGYFANQDVGCWLLVSWPAHYSLQLTCVMLRRPGLFASSRPGIRLPFKAGLTHPLMDYFFPVRLFQRDDTRILKLDMLWNITLSTPTISFASLSIYCIYWSSLWGGRFLCQIWEVSACKTQLIEDQAWTARLANS